MIQHIFYLSIIGKFGGQRSLYGPTSSKIKIIVKWGKCIKILKPISHQYLRGEKMNTVWESWKTPCKKWLVRAVFKRCEGHPSEGIGKIAGEGITLDLENSF